VADLDALVTALNETTRAASSDQFEGLLREMATRGASDLLLVAGVPATYRVARRFQPAGGVLDSAEIEALVLPGIPEHARRQWSAVQIADCSLKVAGVGMFRVNLHRERGRAAATIRLLPTRIPSLQDLRLPDGVELLTKLGPGLVLIGGATGSGKSTTLAALIDVLNRGGHRHIITIEDPIEYEHQHHASVIEQIEIGLDAPDFATALRAAVRQAPDVIVVGEMRDPETMRSALAAAETGHLVFSTLHTTDVAATVGRIADSFPSERQATIRQELAMALSAVFTQSLVRAQDGTRVPACELLVVGYGARQHIRKNALHHLHQEITITRKQGSFTLEEHLQKLVTGGVIDQREAVLRAAHPEELERLLA